MNAAVPHKWINKTLIAGLVWNWKTLHNQSCKQKSRKEEVEKCFQGGVISVKKLFCFLQKMLAKDSTQPDLEAEDGKCQWWGLMDVLEVPAPAGQFTEAATCCCKEYLFNPLAFKVGKIFPFCQTLLILKACFLRMHCLWNGNIQDVLGNIFQAVITFLGKQIGSV